MRLSPFAFGSLVTGLGVFILAPDAALIRLVGLDAWDLAVWRGPAMAFVMVLALLIAYGRRTGAQIRGAFIGFAPLIAVLFSVSTQGFMLGASEGDPAFTVVAVAATPLFAALFSWTLFAEPIDRPTLIAILIGTLGVGLGAFEVLGQQRGTVIGFVGATLIPVGMGLAFTLSRYARPTQSIWAIYLLAGLITGAVGFGVTGTVPWPARDVALVFLVLIFVVGGGSFVLISIGPRYISAAQTSLLLLLETALSPLWVYWLLHEAPGRLTLIGGGILIATLIGQTIAKVWPHQNQAVSYTNG